METIHFFHPESSKPAYRRKLVGTTSNRTRHWHAQDPQVYMYAPMKWRVMLLLTGPG